VVWRGCVDVVVRAAVDVVGVTKHDRLSWSRLLTPLIPSDFVTILKKIMKQIDKQKKRKEKNPRGAYFDLTGVVLVLVVVNGVEIVLDTIVVVTVLCCLGCG
jgi:hypothetical protein